MPINFHIGSSQQEMDFFGKTSWPSQGGETRLALGSANLFMGNARVIGNLIYAGVPERFPDCRFVSVESGVGWVPYFVHRMDAIFEKHCVPYPDYSIKTRPSELFARQVWATFEEEPLGPELIPLLSPDSFMWACDYPHPDSTWPESRKAIEHSLSSLGPEAVRKVVSDNCRTLYRLP